ncbi:MAG: methylenetetrahydrofolate reductase, partial [Cyanobacteria bacterium J06649_11]
SFGQSYNQLQRFAGLGGVSVPDRVTRLFADCDDQETRGLISMHLAAEQCEQLQQEGVENFHFYTLNKAYPTVALCHILGLKEKKA